MKTTSKPTVEKSTRKNSLLSILIIFAAINLSFTSGESYANSFADNGEYVLRTKELIKTSLNDCQSQVMWLEGIELQAAPLICNFYEKNNFKPAWTQGNKPTVQSLALLNLLKDSYKYGFEPSNFDILSLEQFKRSLLKEEKAEKSAMMRVRFEFLLTNSVFAFMSHLTQGTEYSNARDAFVNGNPIISSFPEYLFDVKTAPNITKEILKLQPKDSEYTTLRNEMEVIISNMVTTDHSISIPDIEDDPKSVRELFSYIFIKEGIINESVDISEQAVFAPLLMEFQNLSGIRITGKIDNATCRVVFNFIRTRYEEIAYKLEIIRRRTKNDENLISFNI